MEMKKVFKLPVGSYYTDIHEDVEFNGKKTIGSFDTHPEAMAAALAINSHDDLLKQLSWVSGFLLENSSFSQFKELKEWGFATDKLLSSVELKVGARE
jgi:hypothetical protein